MRIFALLSWWDEDPDHLRRCVKSLRGFADVLVALDGAYESFPGGRAESDPLQGSTVVIEASNAGLKLSYPMVERCWASEVEKRAAMFEYGRLAGATPDDWFLIMDGDMALGAFDENARKTLAVSNRDVAEVRWHDVQVDGKPASTYTFRSMFRALPGLTVERTHYLYTVDCQGCAELPCPGCGPIGRRFVWLLPDGHPSPESILNLTDYVTLHHFNSSRSGERKRAALAYYADRDARRLETVGDWK